MATAMLIATENNEMNNFVKTASHDLNFPIPIFIGLVGNFDLEGCYLDTEYFRYVYSELAHYYDIYGNFVGLSTNDKALYRKICHIKTTAANPAGERLTTSDVLSIFGFAGAENDFKDSSKQFGVEKILNRLMPIARANGGKLSRKDIPEQDYRQLLSKISATGATTKAFFYLYDIDYEGKTNGRLGRVFVKGYPYMREMRAERDRIMAKKGVSFSGGNSKEELYDVLIDASKQAYNKYRSQIFNFEEDAVYNQSKTLIDDELEKGNQTNNKRNCKKSK
jgi:hypothetical protein